ncbi:uncharacterized protein [Diadema antillarum]|uniref:uncharacterized protein n=1 Tax=Diadema antillarum TaxID=105358 RepID=UPI003A8684BA
MDDNSRLRLVLVPLILAIPGCFCTNATDVADVGSPSITMITESEGSTVFSGHTTPIAPQTGKHENDSSTTPKLVKCDIQISGNQDMTNMLDAVISKTIVTILGILAIAINVVWLAVVVFLRLRSNARKRHRWSDTSSDSRSSNSLGLSADDNQQHPTKEPHTRPLSAADTHCSSTQQQTTPACICNGADDDVEMALSEGESFGNLCNDHNSNIKVENGLEESMTMNGGKLTVEVQTVDISPLPSVDGVEFFDLSTCCEDSSTDQCPLKSPSLKFDPSIFDFS